MHSEDIAAAREAADRMAQELEHRNYEKYGPILHKACRYLRLQGTMLYGGAAINELLPAKDRFYSDYTLPDLDVFAQDSETVARGMVQFFKQNGHASATYGPALHSGTYKVYVDGLSVADITKIRPKGWKVLEDGSRKAGAALSGVRIVNPLFLQMSLHMMLSQPIDAHRWEKVFQRLLVFMDAYPPPALSKVRRGLAEAGGSSTGYRPLPKAMDREFRRAIAKDKMIICGTAAIERYLHASGMGPIAIEANGIMRYDLYVAEGSPAEAVERLCRRMGSEDLAPGGNQPADDFVPEHAYILYRGRRWARVFLAPVCLSYVSQGPYRYASMSTMLRTYMALQLSGHPTGNVVGLLQHVFIKSLVSYSDGDRHRPRLLDPFVITCAGHQAGLITLKRQRFDRAPGRAAMPA